MSCLMAALIIYNFILSSLNFKKKSPERQGNQQDDVMNAPKWHKMWRGQNDIESSFWCYKVFSCTRYLQEVRRIEVKDKSQWINYNRNPAQAKSILVQLVAILVTSMTTWVFACSQAHVTLNFSRLCWHYGGPNVYPRIESSESDSC